MYNIDFLPQMDEFRCKLFGSMPACPAIPYEDIRPFATVRLRGRGPDDATRYVPHSSIVMLPCIKDTNGEWVPEDTGEREE